MEGKQSLSSVIEKLSSVLEKHRGSVALNALFYEFLDGLLQAHSSSYFCGGNLVP
jgi:hypothetical protein